MSRLRTLLARGLAATATLWPDIQTAYAWVHQAAHLLANDAGHSAADVRQAYTALLADMHERRETAGALAPAVDQFRQRAPRGGRLPARPDRLRAGLLKSPERHDNVPARSHLRAPRSAQETGVMLRL